ncbi:MAB_1171c family putative transporter [Kitasatospora sp. NPDC098663]|uniref:MAB_1171c family putative transporter n=1 Tax=Kitasatospora sp. NPDC098663 TaxID=3364096 RepID=UPI0037F893AD
MISAIFGGMPLMLLAASLYWAFRRRPGQRPAGTLSLSAFLACFALAFSAYQPTIRAIEDAVALDLSRLVSNSATLSAGASVSSVLLYLNYEAAEARRRVRWRLRLLGLAVATMAVAFALTPRAMMWSTAKAHGGLDPAPASLHIYSAAYIAFLSYAVYDCLTQTWTRSRRATRASQRLGLRTTAAGCVVALVYATYKAVNAIAALFGWNATPGGYRCTSLVTPVSCAFGVTAPAVSVLLITAGLTMPAVLWPLTQFLRHRWERQSITDLAPLWRDLTDVCPNVVLRTIGSATEADLILHRRVVEVCDGILTLDEHRSREVQQAATAIVATTRHIGTETGEAIVEAAVIAGAVRAARADAPFQADPAPQASGATAREGDLRAETLWLRSVSQHYANNSIVRHAADHQFPAFQTA